ncbi:ATP-dependent zinc metalloprotease FtsH [Prochlorococcus sp. MIT 1307]|uniref:ATP-dependent zinc metalloprotease FtsH n=1 Tax=Prochlorococcus sp. MIT 1307 TaxID=3096219 RepID=UPI002A761E73|nr:ATP-dependent zinc metalloprotease FtsH [Prochlorococcus sp. MIT 1307]
MTLRSTFKPSYSKLLSDIEAGIIESLTMVPARREVIVVYKDGSSAKVPILQNDQLILQTAKSSDTQLTVKDIRGEQAIASFAGNFAIVMIFIVGLSILIKRSAKIANRTIGFGRSQPRMKSQEDLNIRFEDVAGISEAKEELLEVVTFLKRPEKLIKLGAQIPKGILLVGPPGTGKTLLAKAIAGEANVPFFSIAASEFVELFVGVGASRVRDLFNKAKQKSPCIIFIDEIDAVGRQRGAGIGGGNDEREQTLNQLLTEMDGFTENSGVILLAATNRPDVLDSALMRPGRFDRRIEVLLPDKNGRLDILAVHARSKPLASNVCLNKIALKTPGFSGADLENLLNESAIVAAREEHKDINDKHIDKALERITMGLSTSALQDSSKKKLIAYHEIGHALVAVLTPLADKLDKVTLLPRGAGIGGFTRFRPDEEILDSGLISRGYLYAKLVVALGGRAAEILVFGQSEVTQGASSDIESVSQIAREMVMTFGFSKLGPISLTESRNEVFLGRSLIQNKLNCAESTSKSVDEEVRFLAKSALEKAIRLLSSRRELMDQLVEALIEEETLSCEKFLSLIGTTELTTS